MVSRDGSFALNGQTLVNGRVETLLRGLALESDGNLDLPVVIVADSQASHQSVVTAIDAIGQAGFARLSIATQRSEQSGHRIQVIDDSTADHSSLGRGWTLYRRLPTYVIHHKAVMLAGMLGFVVLLPLARGHSVARLDAGFHQL